MISSASSYKCVIGDLDKINISGAVMPLRTGAAQKILLGEDIAFLLESFGYIAWVVKGSKPTLRFTRFPMMGQFDLIRDYFNNAEDYYYGSYDTVAFNKNLAFDNGYISKQSSSNAQSISSADILNLPHLDLSLETISNSRVFLAENVMRAFRNQKKLTCFLDLSSHQQDTGRGGFDYYDDTWRSAPDGTNMTKLSSYRTITAQSPLLRTDYKHNRCAVNTSGVYRYEGYATISRGWGASRDLVAMTSRFLPPGTKVTPLMEHRTYHAYGLRYGTGPGSAEQSAGGTLYTAAVYRANSKWISSTMQFGDQVYFTWRELVSPAYGSATLYDGKLQLPSEYHFYNGYDGAVPPASVRFGSLAGTSEGFGGQYLAWEDYYRDVKPFGFLVELADHTKWWSD